MKRLIYIVLAAAALLSTASCSKYKYETVEGDPLGTKIYTLDNGLKVFMTVNKETPRIQTYMAVKVGGKNDPSETTGLAHYFEHLMFKGTPSFGTSDYEAEKPLLDQIEQLFEVYRKTTDEAERAAIYHQIDSISYEASKISIPNEYDKLMSVIGAKGTNAWTSQDETVYTEDIPSNQIENWAKIQADRFRNTTIRGFHTELETIYEEKNMSLTQDSRKVWEALDNALYPHHPYGKQTVLGTQEHLKNPSITNVKKYHDNYYVPNNIAVCLSGDFNPDKMVAIIEKYFGDWEPNPSVPVLKYEKEAPITAPIVRDIYGLEAENLAMAWPLPGNTDLKSRAIATVAEGVLSNGQAGLVDLDVMQQQKVLSLYGGYSGQPDYGQFLMMGRPKAGQTLEQVRDIALEEIAKLRAGEFDDELVSAVKNNYKLDMMRSIEQNSSRARMYVNAFIDGVDWKDYCGILDLVEGVTKEDIIAWAGEYLGENGYAVIYKRQGQPEGVQKVSAPPITPIVTNRDKQSDFLTAIQNSQVKPIEPVFVDFSKDLVQFDVKDGVNALYVKNELNDIFEISYTFYTGNFENPALGHALDYISYLGTPTRSAEQIAKEMYELACSFRANSSDHQSTVTISGLSENMGKAIAIVDDLLLNAVADEEILANLKSDIIRSRMNAKKQQRSCYSALLKYAYYGAESIKSSTLDNAAVSALTSEELLAAVKGLYGKSHEIAYYGPMKVSEVKDVIAENHVMGDSLEQLSEKFTPYLTTPENSVILAQYDAKQIYYQQYSNRGETFQKEADPELTLYNEYFGGGMNAIVFQEMREARGLAYSAWARVYSPSFADDNYTFEAFIATQNDKMRTAIEAFDEIINEMPESQAAFDVAKEALISRIRTSRTTGKGIISAYRSCRRQGLSEPLTKARFQTVQNLTLSDVKATQEKWAKDRTYTYCILGDIKDLDTDFLKTLGPVKTVTLEDIFGY